VGDETDAIYYLPHEVQPMLKAANDLYVQTRDERDEAREDADAFRAALKREVADHQKERDAVRQHITWLTQENERLRLELQEERDLCEHLRDKLAKRDR
jgi:hypothetical protein